MRYIETYAGDFSLEDESDGFGSELTTRELVLPEAPSDRKHQAYKQWAAGLCVHSYHSDTGRGGMIAVSSTTTHPFVSSPETGTRHRASESIVRPRNIEKESHVKKMEEIAAA